MNRIDMAGKTVVITGGARGIGYAIGERLVQSGARVAIWDLRLEESKASAGALSKDCIGLSVDVSDSLSVEHAPRTKTHRSGRAHGICQLRHKIEKMIGCRSHQESSSGGIFQRIRNHLNRVVPTQSGFHILEIGIVKRLPACVLNRPSNAVGIV